jgi:molybdopterin synthase catalytic subunit
MAHILYFGPARERTGVDSEEIAFDKAIDIDGFWAQLISRHPSLDELRSSCRIAVDMHYVDDSSVIQPDAEIAVIPPVAGG